MLLGSSNLAAHFDAVVRTTVVASAADEDVGDISDDAASAGVVLTRAAEPVAVLVDVDFARGVVVTQEPSRNNRNNVLPVITLGTIKAC